jgi:putative DNA primase/helicase
LYQFLPEFSHYYRELFMDFAAINSRLAQSAEAYLPSWIPGGKFGTGQHGRYYSACNPLRGERNPSLTVYLSEGNWRDETGDGSGGDLISLYAYLHNLKQIEAATKLAAEVGIEVEPPKPAKPIPPRPQAHKQLGKPSATWVYNDKSGRAVFWVHRFERDGGKEFRPQHFDGKKGEWVWSDPPGKLPLYHLDRIHAKPGAALLFTEGEKAADAAGAFFPEHVQTATAHGAQSPGKSDLSHAKGRHCLIWPDNDSPGEKYAQELARLLHNAGAALVEILELPAGLPAKFDAADAGEDSNPQAWQRRVWLPAEVMIVVNGKRLSTELTAPALEALAARNNPARLFNRDGRLVRLQQSESGDGGLVLALPPVDAVLLKHEMERKVIWMRENPKGDLVHIPPPDVVVNDAMAMPDYPMFPRLHKVVTAPCVSSRGNIIATAGYDKESGIFYHQSEPLKIPDTKPTPAALKAAVALLFETWLADFPFADEASKSHAMALFLLPFCRALIDGVTPLHFPTAPTQRTGKTLLVEMLAGVFDPLASPGAAPESGNDTDSEWRKKITSALLTESAHVWIDNIKGMIASGALEAALTARFWTDRALGSNRQLTLRNDRVWVFTGNNAELSQDLYGRAIEIRLDANVENPGERDGFKIANIRQWTRQHRGELCGAALVLIRNWLESGRPEPAEGTPRLGGFEEWRRVMGGILSAAGVQGFLMNRAETKERVNGDQDIFKGFISQWAAWAKAKNGDKLIVVAPKDLYPIAKESGLFDDALSSSSEAGESRRLGRWLTKNTDRVFVVEGIPLKLKSGKEPAKSKKGYYLQSPNQKPITSPLQNQVTLEMGEIGEMGGKSNQAGIGALAESPPISPISGISNPPVSPELGVIATPQETSGIAGFDGFGESGSTEGMVFEGEI